MIDSQTMANPEKYFDNTSLRFEIGEVCKISIVPSLYSSANKRIVKAGTNTRNKNGDSENKPFIWVNPESRILKSLENSHRKAPFVSK